MTERPNFFSLLELEPQKSWSQKDFEQKLHQKRAEWGKKSKLPGKKGMIYREYLSLFPQIKEIMNDELKRSQEMAALEQVVNTTSNYHPFSESRGRENSSQKKSNSGEQKKCPNKILFLVLTWELLILVLLMWMNMVALV